MSWRVVGSSLVLTLAAGCGHNCQFNADCPAGQECLFMASDDSAEMCCPSNLQCGDTCCDNNSSCLNDACLDTSGSPPQP